MNVIQDTTNFKDYEVSFQILVNLKKPHQEWFAIGWWNLNQKPHSKSVFFPFHRLKENSPVVKFKDGEDQLMLVTFNPQFITFCNDVIEFEALGFRIPEQLKNTARNASKFISHARHLQQIAAFHNTVGDRMVPCQRPIMLKNAMELSRLVKSESVSWNDETSVVRYISVLQAAVNKLSHDNNLLTSYHNNAIKIVSQIWFSFWLKKMLNETHNNSRLQN